MGQIGTSPISDNTQAEIRPHLSYILDADYRFTYVSKFTCAVLGYVEAELLNLSAMVLRPDFDPTARRRIVHLAREHPNQPWPLPDSYLLGRGGRRIDVFDGTITWSTEELLIVEFAISPAEAARVEGYGLAFRDPRVWAETQDQLTAREREHIAELARLRAEIEPLARLKAADRHEPKPRSWADADELRRALGEIFEAIAAESDGWSTVRVEDVCHRLSAREHISSNTLRKRFGTNGWLRGRSLAISLREMMLDDLGERLF